MAKRLRQEISLEITKVKQLRKFKEINDRIESGNALPEDFKPGVNTNYYLVKDNIMDSRGRFIYPLGNLVHQFNCIVNNHKQYYTEGFTSSVERNTEDPFADFREDIEEIMQDDVILFDAEEMFNDMLIKETYDNHMLRLNSIANNKE